MLLIALLLFTWLLSPQTSNAQGQRPSGSTSQSVIDKQQKTITDLLDKVTDLQNQNAASKEAILAMREERDAAKLALDQAGQTIKSADAVITAAQKALDTSDRAIAQQQKTIESMEKANQKALELVDRYDKRITTLEDKLDKANSRTVKAGALGLIVGILSRVF